MLERLRSSSLVPFDDAFLRGTHVGGAPLGDVARSADCTAWPLTYARPSLTSMSMGPKRLSHTYRSSPSAASGNSTWSLRVCPTWTSESNAFTASSVSRPRRQRAYGYGLRWVIRARSRCAGASWARCWVWVDRAGGMSRAWSDLQRTGTVYPISTGYKNSYLLRPRQV